MNLENQHKVELYRILRENFSLNIPYPLAVIGEYLKSRQIKSADYGFEKLRTLFEQMPECVALMPFSAGKIINYNITLLPWETETEGVTAMPTKVEPQAPLQGETDSGVRRLTDIEKRAIYELLLEEFPTEVALPMASISLVMTNEGYRKETFGFVKMKQMLKELSLFMSLQDTVTNGVPATLIVLHRVSVWDSTPAGKAAVSDVSLPVSMEQVVLPAKTLAILHQLLTGEEGVPSSEEIAELKESYLAAKAADAFTPRNNAFTFETTLKSLSDDGVIASIKPSKYEGDGNWYLNFVGLNRNTVDAPGKSIEKFAFMGYWDKVLNELAEMALPEKWYFQGEDPESKQMLRGYLQYTFYRLQLEDKICVSDDGQFAAFNTGLVTPRYDDIFACFEPKEDTRKSKWRFIGFSKSGGRGIGKRIVNYFNPLPQPASYFERKEDLLFDLEKELHPDYDHIILDNISRLPIRFLREELHSEPEALELLRRIEEEQLPLAKRKLYYALRKYVEDSDRMYNRLRNRVGDAIGLARKQVRWNYKTALPCFFPTRNVMSLMLPLCLVEDGHVDVALVAELTRAGNYQGQTILTLQQAYIDARLICRPNSEWLNTEEIPLDANLYWESD